MEDETDGVAEVEVDVVESGGSETGQVGGGVLNTRMEGGGEESGGRAEMGAEIVEEIGIGVRGLEEFAGVAGLPDVERCEDMGDLLSLWKTSSYSLIGVCCQ